MMLIFACDLSHCINFFYVCAVIMSSVWGTPWVSMFIVSTLW